MPYPDITMIGVSRRLKDFLDRYRDKNESWQEFLRALFNGWLQNEKRKQGK